MNAIAAPGLDQGARDTVADLALIYLRHGDAERALALGIAAMKIARPTPEQVLIVAEAFIRLEQPEQADAALSRFHTDPDTLLDGPVTPDHWIACHSMAARIAWHTGEADAARASLAKAKQVMDRQGAIPA